MSTQISIIVAEPDPEMQDRLGQELAPFDEHISAYLCQSGNEAYQTSKSISGLRLLITEVVLPELDGINLLINIRQTTPHISAIILSDYDLSEYAPYLGGARVLPRAFHNGQLTALVQELIPELRKAQYQGVQTSQGAPTAYAVSNQPPSQTNPSMSQMPISAPSGVNPPTEFSAAATSQQRIYPEQTLSLQAGTRVGSYIIQQELPATEWGSSYLTAQAGVNRPARLIFHNNHSTYTAQQFIDYFTRLASIPHPNLTTIIEIGEYEGHPFVAEELWSGRPLTDFIAANVKLDSRQASHLAEQALNALAHLSHLPCRTVTAADLLINNTGVLKLGHILAPPGTSPCSTQSQLQAIANIVRGLLNPNASNDPRINRMLDMMSNGSISPEQAASAFHTLQIELAPVQQRAETEEAREIAAQLEKQERSKQAGLIILILTMLSITAAIVIFFYRDAILEFLGGQQGRDFTNDMQRIPAGAVQMEIQDPDNPNATITTTISTPEFWISTYEVTIFEYAQFLRATRQPGFDRTAVIHPDTPPTLDFVPNDWDKILSAALKNGFYGDSQLTPRSPIFNVDFYSAYAYAKWRGKRLPTAEEWLKAARGPEGFLFPWGNQFDASKANIGLDYTPGDPRKGGEKDGFNGIGPVDSPKMAGDVSPYGVRLMYGNVMEWTSSPGGLRLGRETMRVMGNSFSTQDPRPLSHPGSSPLSPLARNLFTGFRLVSDSPPEK